MTCGMKAVGLEFAAGGVRPGQAPDRGAVLPSVRLRGRPPRYPLSPGVARLPTIPTPLILCLFLATQESKLESQ